MKGLLIWISLGKRPALCTFHSILSVHTVLSMHPLWSMLPPELKQLIRDASAEPVHCVKLCSYRGCKCFYPIDCYVPIRYIEQMVTSRLKVVRSSHEIDPADIRRVLRNSTGEVHAIYSRRVSTVIEFWTHRGASIGIALLNAAFPNSNFTWISAVSSIAKKYVPNDAISANVNCAKSTPELECNV
jgi:hypothetical protein